MGTSIPHHHEDHIARKKGQFTATLQFDSQICFHASSLKQFLQRTKPAVGQGMGKIGENFGVEPDESQKKETSDH